MTYPRVLLVVMTLSLAACGSDITGPDSSTPSSKPAMGVVTLGSGT